ncbi:MAG: hypothetical protein JW748_00325 [Anaerolineales bacterium]|nr:hypothetical protein [Anaerolineales bacterium]
MRTEILLILPLIISACAGPAASPAAPASSPTPEAATQAQPSASPRFETLPAPDRQPYALGISLEAGSYGARAFANIFKNDARVWVPGTMDPGPVDERGMPVSDFDLYALDGAYIRETSGFNGTYTLYFNGLADVDAMSGTVQDQHYDDAQNLTKARLLVTEPYPTIILYFRNTQRTAESAVDTGVTGLKLMRPLGIGGGESYPPDAIFTAEYLELHARGEVLRFMDFTATNGNIQRAWADRSTPDDLTFYGETPGYWWQGKGAPWEYAILLANTLEKDIWINIPAFAGDDYVAQLADLLYTALDRDLKVYVEYSNELWNFGFPQWTHMEELVDRDLAGNPHTSINFDGLVRSAGGETDYGLGVPRYWARRVMEISGNFRDRFGGDAMFSRVRPLFETQAAWRHWLATGLLFLDMYYNNADGVAHVDDPHPVNSYLWGGGGSGYVHGMPEELADDPNIRVDDIFDAYEKAWPEHYSTMAADVYWLSAFGLKRVAYESGPGLDDFADKDSAVQQAQIDPRMESVYRRAADTFFEAGGDLYVTFLGVGLAHGLLPYDAVIGSQPIPKLKAFDAMLAATERPAPTAGYRIPGAIPGGRYHIREDGWSMGDHDGSIRLEGAYAWAGYTIHAATAGQYSITLETANSEGGQATLWVDGAAVSTGLYCPDGGATESATVTLAPGVHAVRVKANAGGFELNTIRVKLTATAPRLQAAWPSGGEKMLICDFSFSDRMILGSRRRPSDPGLAR